MSGLFGGGAKVEKPPEKSDAEIERERRRKIVAMQGGGKGSTTLTGGAGITAPILGAAAQLVGGMS
jgi:hypothetical protein